MNEGSPGKAPLKLPSRDALGLHVVVVLVLSHHHEGPLVPPHLLPLLAVHPLKLLSHQLVPHIGGTYIGDNMIIFMNIKIMMITFPL